MADVCNGRFDADTLPHVSQELPQWVDPERLFLFLAHTTTLYTPACNRKF
jgi:hypothetical protein